MKLCYASSASNVTNTGSSAIAEVIYVIKLGALIFLFRYTFILVTKTSVLFIKFSTLVHRSCLQYSKDVPKSSTSLWALALWRSVTPGGRPEQECSFFFFSYKSRKKHFCIDVTRCNGLFYTKFPSQLSVKKHSVQKRVHVIFYIQKYAHYTEHIILSAYLLLINFHHNKCVLKMT